MLQVCERSKEGSERRGRKDIINNRNMERVRDRRRERERITDEHKKRDTKGERERQNTTR